MPDTTARGIVFPTVGDQVAPLEERFEQMAETTDDAITDALSSLGLQWRSLRNNGWTHTSSGDWLTSVGWIAADGDPGNGIGISYSNGVFTVSEPGVYAALLTLAFTAHATGTRGGRFLTTGSVAAGARSGWLGRTSATESGFAWYLGALPAGGVLTIQAFQSSGGSLALSDPGVSTQFNRVAMVRLGAGA